MEKLYVKVHDLETKGSSILPFLVKVSFKKQQFKTAKLSDKKYKFNEEFTFPLSSKVNSTDCIHIELCTSLVLTVRVGEVYFSLNKIRRENMVKTKIPLKDESTKYLLTMTILVIRDNNDILFFKMKQKFPQVQEYQIREVLNRETDEKKVVNELKDQEDKMQNNGVKDLTQANIAHNYVMNVQPDMLMKKEDQFNSIGIQENGYGIKNALPLSMVNQAYNGNNMNQPNMYSNTNMMSPMNQGNPNIINSNPMMQSHNIGSSVASNNSPMNSNFNTQLYGSNQTYQPNQMYPPIQTYQPNQTYLGVGTNMYNPHLNPGADNIFFHTGQNKKKALLIGINYYGSNCELNGCVNDTLRMKNLLISQYGFVDSSLTMIRLIDNANDPKYRPTRNNILSACAWLTSGNQMGDVLFFLYSGHGSQQEDPHNIEEDGYNETILPCDHKQVGEITDDELHRYLIQPLHNGVKLVAVMDCCRAGTSLDLAYEYKWMKQKWKEIKNPFHVVCDVSQFSGCRDEEVSYELDNKKNAPGGSLVTALIYVLANARVNLSYDVLLRQVNNCIQKYHSQTVAFMSSQKFDMNRIFDFENILMNKNQNLGLTINYYRQPKKKKRNPIFFF